MDKLNFHDTIRIYLPGLLLSGMVHLFYYGTIKDMIMVAIPALFIGFLLEAIFRPFYAKNFEYIVFNKIISFYGQKMTYLAALKIIIYHQLEIKNSTYVEKFKKCEERTDVYDLSVCHVNRSYTNESLSAFRSPKSFGVLSYMCYIICSLAVVFCAFILFLKHYTDVRMIFDVRIKSILHLDYAILILIAALLLFRAASKFYFTKSLKKEIEYWSNMSDQDIIIFEKSIDLLDRFKNGIIVNTQESVELI